MCALTQNPNYKPEKVSRFASKNQPNIMESQATTSSFKFSHKWILNSFPALARTHTWAPSFLVSENFSPLARKSLDAYLEINPKGEDSHSQEFLSVFLCIDGSYLREEAQIQVKYRVSILDKDGEVFCCKESQNYLNSTARFGWSRYLKTEHLLAPENAILANNKLTILVAVEILNSSLSSRNSGIPRITRSYLDCKSRLSPCRHQWTIDSLHSFRNEEDVEFYPINSEPFSPEGGSGSIQFNLKLYPINQKNTLKLNLFFKSTTMAQIKVQFRFALSTGKSTRIFIMSAQESLTSGKGFGWSIPVDPGILHHRILLLCEAQLNPESGTPFPKSILNENLCTAMNSLTSLTSNLRALLLPTIGSSGITSAENDSESERLLSSQETSLGESYFNARPKILDSLIHTWAIHHYSDFLYEFDQMKNTLQSAKFRSRRNEQREFKLKLYPKGHAVRSNGYNSVYCVYCGTARERIVVNVSLAILDSSGEKRFCKVIRHTFGANSNPFYQEDYLGLYLVLNEVLLNEKEGLLLDDTLTVWCEIQIIDDRPPERRIEENRDSCVEQRADSWAPEEAEPLL